MSPKSSLSITRCPLSLLVMMTRPDFLDTDATAKPGLPPLCMMKSRVLGVSYLPAQGLRNRVIDFCVRPEHFRKAVLTESKGVACFWLDDFDEKLRVVR